jgi:two-component system, OmpR family, KDP operon response regulator KdpE
MSPDSAKVLVIEDEPEIRRFLRASLGAHGYRLTEAHTGQAGLVQAASDPPDVVILDLGLPDIDGLQVIRQLRSWSQVPIVVLSARGQEDDKVIALDNGADDYVTKPFGISELLARMRVALRHASRPTDGEATPEFTVQNLRVDFVRRQVFVAGDEIHLTPTEYRLLTTLVKHAGKVLTHRQLLKEVWGPDSVHENQYLRVFMNQLRQKVEMNPARPLILLTEPGIGYRLATNE